MPFNVIAIIRLPITHDLQAAETGVDLGRIRVGGAHAADGFFV